ncbi:MAG: minor capsid protein [Oscillospiraceae bacterium]|nr:minor capsid protein [Oscillospiraceae bacterium]
MTYKELREAYLRGEITNKIYERWTYDYARFVREHLAREWEIAAKAAASDLAARYPQFLYEPSIEAAAAYIRRHSAELVTNVTQGQKQAINAAIAHLTGYTAVTPDEAAYILRPMVGLTMPQTVANARYFEHVRQSYLEAHPRCRPETASKKAAEAAARYAGRQHRYRAQNIARTELAFAYNAGAYGATKDAQERGYIGECVKVWVTADDERTCPVCGELDGRKASMDALFSIGKLMPPAHPSCRCAVAFEEIESTNLNPAP